MAHARANTLSAGVPLTPSQELFWTGQKLAPDVPLYNMAWRFDIFSELDPHVFAKAFQQVVQEHDAMRAVFMERDGEVVSVLAEKSPDFPPIVDLCAATDPDAEAERWIDERVGHAFDLAQCNYSTALLKLGSDQWVWFFNQHHIACDAHSASLLFQAVSDAYNGITNMRDVTTSPVSEPFFDYARQLANVRDDVALQSARAHWMDSGEDRQIAPAFYGARPSQSPASTRLSIDIGRSEHQRLTELSEDPRYRLLSAPLTEFALLFTAFAAFVFRITGEKRVVIGVPAHNRSTQVERQMIGLLVEVFPIEIEVQKDDSFSSLYARVKTEIGEFLRNARPGSSSAVAARRYGSVLNFVREDFGPFAGAPAKAQWRHSGTHDPRHGIRLHAWAFDAAAPLSLSMDVNNAILQQTSVDAVPQHFLALLGAFLADPDCRVATVPLATKSEIAAMLPQISGLSETADLSATVLDHFAAQVAQTPDRMALREGDRIISYRELDQASEACANYLAENGLSPGDAVLIHARRSAALVVTVLGILKSGGQFVPVAASTPRERLLQIARLAEPAFVLADQPCSVGARATGLRVIDIEEKLQSVTFTRNGLPIRSKAAYTIFTSGSTGQPKGVLVKHADLARYAIWAARVFGGAEPADYAFFSSINFDLTITSIFAPLVSGGGIVIYPETEGADMAVLDVIADDAVDVLKLTPSHLSLTCTDAHSVRRIKTLVLGGENLSTAACRRALERLSPTLDIVNEYGPTEAVVGCMIHRFDLSSDLEVSVPIGVPADGVNISIRDDGLSLAPYGVVGEICIGGRLARGYYRRPDETAKSFVDDPLSTGSRIYRTGDLGRLLPSGQFEYLGRSDQQLKVGGVRVEAAEIEAAALSAPGVRSAYVAQLPSTPPSSKQRCVRCGLPGTYPGTTFDDAGLCNICRDFDTYRDRAEAYFGTPDELVERVRAAAERSTGDYDVIMLLSGGKDSTYAAYRLAELSDRVLALTLDNGFISDGAKANIRRVCDHLGWDHQFIATEVMNDIFVDSLKVHSNVCHGCFKTIYTLALRVARDQCIPAIVTGLSRGQFFETRLTPDLFKMANPTKEQIESIVSQARKTYHRQHDAIARLLETDDLEDGVVLEQTEFIDLYRYVDVPVAEIYRFLAANAPWIRPEDTGRSTNCLINDVGIYVHQRREGFHNYALPYSWDVRMGHKTREEATDELDDTIDEERVKSILKRIGFDEEVEVERRHPAIAIYAAASPETQEDEIWSALRARLQPEVMPDYVVLLDKMPLTENGKVDVARLPAVHRQKLRPKVDYAPPTNEMERQLVEIYQEFTGVPRVGINDNFHDLGGDSLAAVQIAIKANAVGLKLPTTAVFQYPTVAEIAARFSGAAQPDVKDAADETLVTLDEDDLSAITRALS